MIEDRIKKHFEKHLSVPCFFSTPEKPLNEYVLIERTGGHVENFLKHATFAFQSISGVSPLRAVQISEEVVAAADLMTTVENIFSVIENGTYNYTNTKTKQYRYQSVFDITYM